MDLSERGIHKILKKMNKSLIEYQKAEDLKNTPEPKFYQWYLDLEYLVDSNYYRDDIIIGKLLDKLATYGKVTWKNIF